jgi:hypothetical protein
VTNGSTTSEDVVSENERFMVVEKIDNGGQSAETLDPRNTDQP